MSDAGIPQNPKPGKQAPGGAQIVRLDDAAAREAAAAGGAAGAVMDVDSPARRDRWNRRMAFYEKHFGPCEFAVQEVLQQKPRVDILIFPPNPERNRYYYTLVTSGMSDERMNTPPDLPKRMGRCELITYLEDANIGAEGLKTAWPVQVLSYLAHLPFLYKTWLGESHTIPNGDPPVPFVPETRLTTALLLPPIYEDEAFHSEGLYYSGEQVQFYWVSFITRAETEFKLANGYEALMRKFEAADFPVTIVADRADLL